MQNMQVKNSFESVDVDWAWSPWQPTAQAPWNVEHAARLLRRAGFGAEPEQLAKAASRSLSELLDELLTPPRSGSEFQLASDQLAQSALGSGESKGLSTWWLHDMLKSPTPLVEKMTLFWHGHFATGADKVKEPQVMLNQNRLLRQHALGDVRQLVHGISKDAAMLVYLDSAVNRKAHPNENFARELMELFCLGEGNYTESDVQQLARCFTGWEVRRNQFRFNSFQHDGGAKQLLNQNDVHSGEQAVDVVLESPHAATFIVGKLFRFFLADEPHAGDKLLKPLADQLRADNWNMAGTIRRMLGSQLMFSPLVQGRKIRSPIDWALNWMKACQLTTNLNRVSDALSELGQALFYPPNVKGWDGGRAWINSSTLVGRTNLISQLVRDPATRWQGGTMSDFWRNQSVRSLDDLLHWAQTHLLAIPLSNSSQQQLRQSLVDAGGVNRLTDCLVLIAALPEMQLC